MIYTFAVLLLLSVVTSWNLYFRVQVLRLRLTEEKYRKRTAWAPVGGLAGDSYEITCACDCGKSVDVVVVNTITKAAP